VTEGVDYLVLGAPDLTTGVRHVEGLLGRRAVLGGRHPLSKAKKGASRRMPVMRRLTDPAKVIAEGLVPFLIDWGNSDPGNT
jgi:hypothetical protein